ncbi:MAG: cell wall hydrolase [Lachnospiraceae bacterium]|nr:cell wall hydrolase [Lachnospiraceae bacterium]
MLKQRRWFVLFAVFCFTLAVKVMIPGDDTTTVYAKAEKHQPICVAPEEADSENAADLETDGRISSELLAVRVLEKIKQDDLQLMTSSTDHIVSYHGKRYAITDDEYQVLLKIVEAEAPEEDILGKMLVANVVLNRVEVNFFGDTISEVVFAKGQFQPVSNGSIFRVTPSAETIEAVERVLAGEDESQGALYFMARDKSYRSNVRWFDHNLVFLFEHGGHEFFTEK